jgi:hypothetical protein
VDAILERSRQLKQNLIEFVLDAEDELAVALETYFATRSRSKDSRYDAAFEKNLLLDMFLTEGKVGNKTPLDLFLENNGELSQSDRNLIQNWQRSFIGLFAVTQILPDGFDLRNWLTDKHYTLSWAKFYSLGLPQLQIIIGCFLALANQWVI